MTAKRKTLTKKQKFRYAAYSFAVVLSFFAIFDGVVHWLEASGGMDTSIDADRVSRLDRVPYVDNGKGFWVTRSSATKSMVPSKFRRPKGKGWRLFVVGGSFAKGAPYSGDEERAGGLVYWLRRELQARFPITNVEVINAAASAQNSSRVLEIAEHVLELEPDILLVATCNNEGVIPPSQLDSVLSQTGSYRLIRRWIRGSDNDKQRPHYTPQDPDTKRVLALFERNVNTMVDKAKARGVPVLLATLPLNLRYLGEEPGLPAHGYTRDETGRPISACVTQGIEAYKLGKYEAAERQLRLCRDFESLRWLGVTLYAQRRYTEAKLILSQYTELVPRNRCRPSFNKVIREIARTHKHVHLLDFEKDIELLAPNQVPGPELFVDYCHLLWHANGALADKVMTLLRAVSLLPKDKEQNIQLPSRDTVMRQMMADEE